MASADDPDHGYQKERARVKDSGLSDVDTEAVLEFMAALDPDDLSATYTNDKGQQETLAYSSLVGYGRGLRTVAAELDGDLLDATAEDLREAFDAMDSVSRKTVRQRQAAARKFYRYHETDVEPRDIPLFNVESGSNVDDRDTLDSEDIQAIREACNELRDRALIELLVYTGQRLRAIQTLRIKDIDLDEGVYYLNTDEAGLKNADKIGGKRPLLGAEKAVRQWIQNHPTGEPDDYLITALPSATGTNGPGEYLSKISIYNRLGKLFDEAEGVEKPDGQMAHAFRHYFATTAYRDFDMDPTTIKWLMGHAEESTLWESTYQHLRDQDHIDAAREASDMGRESSRDETAMTPKTCPTCNEPLAPSAKACPDCGMVFTPDAKAAQDQLQEGAETRVVELENETEAEIVSAVLSDLRENPEDYLGGE